MNKSLRQDEKTQVLHNIRILKNQLLTFLKHLINLSRMVNRIFFFPHKDCGLNLKRRVCEVHRMTKLQPFDVLHSRISLNCACSPDNVLVSHFIISVCKTFEAAWLQFMNDNRGEKVSAESIAADTWGDDYEPHGKMTVFHTDLWPGFKVTEYKVKKSLSPLVLWSCGILSLFSCSFLDKLNWLID